MWDARKHVQAEDEEIAGDKRTVSRKAGLLKYTFMRMPHFYEKFQKTNKKTLILQVFWYKLPIVKM